MSTRKKYSTEFKLDAVSLVLDQHYSRAEASRNLGVNPNLIGRWVKEHKAEHGLAFRGQGKLTPEQKELRDLRNKVKRLEMERDILKKATVFFAGETK
jgi:transposase